MRNMLSLPAARAAGFRLAASAILGLPVAAAAALLAAVAVLALPPLASPAAGADLSQAPAAVVVVADNVCLTGRAVDIHPAPATYTSGVLPAGMEVEVIDFPFDAQRDLWVRIKPPRIGDYYGWVATRDLVCL